MRRCAASIASLHKLQHAACRGTSSMTWISLASAVQRVGRTSYSSHGRHIPVALITQHGSLWPRAFSSLASQGGGMGGNGGAACRRPSEEAKRVILEAARTLQSLASNVGDSFDSAIALIEAVPPGGRVVLTGVGKSGHVARKIAASMSSTGTCAFFMHATEALHGDLGSVRAGDVCIAISYSGETQETLAALRGFHKLSRGSIAITSDCSSTLGKECDVCLPLGAITELDHNKLAPTASTAAAMALGDALTVVMSKRRSFTRDDFDLYHPGGQLGLQNRMALAAGRLSAGVSDREVHDHEQVDGRGRLETDVRA